MIYLHGPGSARSQAVPCVKTCSSLSALRRPGERKEVVRVQTGLKTPQIGLVIGHTGLRVSGKKTASLLIQSSLSQSVKAARITDTVIQLKKQSGSLHPPHVSPVLLAPTSPI